MSTTSWANLRNVAAQSNGTTSFDPLPVPGPYPVVVEECTYGPASTGSPMWKIKFRVTSGPHENRRQWHNVVMKPDSPDSVRWFFETMGALGLGPEFFDTEPSYDSVAEALLERLATLTLKTGKPYKGQKKSEVSKIEPATGEPVISAPIPSPTPAPSPETGTVTGAPKPPF